MKREKAPLRLGGIGFISLGILGLLMLSCGSFNQLVSLIQTPTPTSTATLTPTSTPTPTTGRLDGTLEEAELTKEHERPLMNGALIVLCLKTSTNQCTIDENLSAKSDDKGGFVIDAIPPAEYVVLHNPFPIKDISAYWKYWDGRQLTFTDASAFMKSLAPGRTIQLCSGPGGGISVSIVNGKTQFAVIRGNTGIWPKSESIVVEFVDEQTPLSVDIVLGKTTEVVISSHACILSE